MKHLFFIHSSTTELVSKGVINSLDLIPTEVVWITDRNYTCKSGLHSSFVLPEKQFQSTFAIFENRRILKDLDKFVNRICGNTSFTIYIPHVYDYRIYTIVTHKQCESFNFIEEGMMSYYTMNEANQLFRRNDNVLKKLGRDIATQLSFGNRLQQDDKVFIDGFRSVYGLYEESFPGFRPKVIVDFKLNNVVNNYDVVFIIGAEVEVGHIELDDYIKLYSRVIMMLKQLNYRRLRIGVKFHPMQSIEVKSDFKNIFGTDRFSFLEIGNDEKIESFYGHGNDPLFIQTNSSAGFYASKKGAKVISLSALNNNLNINRKKLPSIYSDMVKHPELSDDIAKVIGEFVTNIAS